MDKPLCSLLVIVNKESVYQQLLYNLQTQQDISYELIEINNRNYQYRSARAAFNENVHRANGKYLVFMHPDICFLDSRAFRDIMDHVQALGQFGVAGIAGSPETLVQNQRVILSSILHGHKMTPAGEYVKIPAPVQTLDECMFIVDADYFRQAPLSDAPGWHLYCVEHCLQCILDGRKNFVVPAHVWHHSAGKSLDVNYIPQLELLIDKYKDHFRLINTTVRKWHTKGFGYWLFRRYYACKQRIKSKLL